MNPLLEKTDSSKPDPDYVRNLVSLWTHQNGVVWGRLTTMITTQSASIAAMYAVRDVPLYGIIVSAVAVTISVVMARLVHCDLAWKDNIGTRLRMADDRLLPEGEKLQTKRRGRPTDGWKVMDFLAIGFAIINVVLLIVFVVLHATA